MNIFETNTTIPKRWLIVIFFIIFITVGILYVFYFNRTTDPNYINNNIVAITGGLTASCLIAFIQFGLSWYEHKMYDNFKKHGVRDVLPNKYAQAEYGKIIKNVNQRLWIMGNTAYDLLDHFTEQSKDLLEILAKKRDVRLLIATKNSLQDERHKRNYDGALGKIEALRKQYQNLQVKYYDHEPSQSIFIFDNECFLGPIFPDERSRETPCIRMATDSIFAQKYIKYFEREWKEAV
ncbi:MAG: hypothetical protein PHE67_05045 [Campylobacterales bacterium]|nr:hypothetical protein [Campylobacterales bacterium]